MPLPDLTGGSPKLLHKLYPFVANLGIGHSQAAFIKFFINRAKLLCTCGVLEKTGTIENYCAQH